MTNRDPNDPKNRTETLAEQKERLILQCRAYRIAVGNARSVVRANMGREAIAKTAVGMVSARAQSALANFSDLVDFRSLSGAKLQKLLPLVISGASLLSRRALWKPVLRGAAVVGAVGTGLYLFSRRKKTHEQHEHIARHKQL